jgi:hypothetical protein
MKNVVIEDKGNYYFKLTVSTSEIRIKIQQGVDDTIKQMYIDKLLKVANTSEMVNCVNTFRGKTKYVKQGNRIDISMETDSKKQQYQYLNI